jgi:hypothetical protein
MVADPLGNLASSHFTQLDANMAWRAALPLLTGTQAGSRSDSDAAPAIAVPNDGECRNSVGERLLGPAYQSVQLVVRNHDSS